MIASTLLGIVVAGGIAVAGDADEVGDAVRQLSVGWFLAALVLGSLAHAIRGVRWHWYLLRIGSRVGSRIGSRVDSAGGDGSTFPVRRSAEVYAAGVAMQVTPGRAGEWVKSYYVQALGGAPAARTAPIVLAERVTDMFGLIALALAGAIVYREGMVIVGASAGLAVALLVVLTSERASRGVASVASRLPLARRLVPHLDEFRGASAELLSPNALATATAISVLSWVVEVFAYWFVLRGLGVEATSATLFQAGFVWPVATLAGGLLLTPAGLGVAEGGLVAIGATIIDGLARGPAAAAALVTRVATLWVPTLIGLVAAMSLGRRVSRAAAGDVSATSDIETRSNPEADRPG